jgi:hypothetical protein
MWVERVAGREEGREPSYTCLRCLGDRLRKAFIHFPSLPMTNISEASFYLCVFKRQSTPFAPFYPPNSTECDGSPPSFFGFIHHAPLPH